MEIPSIIDRNYYIIKSTTTGSAWICEAKRFDDRANKLYYYYGTYDLNSLVCRDAYWQVAGEELGLENPWEPDEEDEIFIIGYNRISGIYKSHGICTDNFILSFSTEEMRDAFYENFKDLIEQCKELL